MDARKIPNGCNGPFVVLTSALSMGTLLLKKGGTIFHVRQKEDKPV